LILIIDMPDFPLFIALVLVYYAAACYFLDLGNPEREPTLLAAASVNLSKLSTVELPTVELPTVELPTVELLPIKRKAGRPRKLKNHPVLK
jgi:hypothetical protein